MCNNCGCNDRWTDCGCGSIVKPGEVRMGDLKVGGLYIVADDAKKYGGSVAVETPVFKRIHMGNSFFVVRHYVGDPSADLEEKAYHYWDIIWAEGVGTLHALGNDRFTNISRFRVLWEPIVTKTVPTRIEMCYA
jgi:hypothetical protein